MAKLPGIRIALEGGIGSRIITALAPCYARSLACEVLAAKGLRIIARPATGRQKETATAPGEAAKDEAYAVSEERGSTKNI